MLDALIEFLRPVSLLGISAFFLVSLGALFGRKNEARERAVAACAWFATGWVALYHFMLVEGDREILRFMYPWSPALMFLAGPLLTRIVYRLARIPGGLPGPFVAHLVPGVLILAALLFAALANPGLSDRALNTLAVPEASGEHWLTRQAPYSVIYVAGLAHLAIYLLAALLPLIAALRWSRLKLHAASRVLLFAQLGGTLLGVLTWAGVWLESWVLFQLAERWSNAFWLIGLALARRYPGYFKELRPLIVERRRYVVSHIRGIDSTRARTELIAAFETGRCYEDPELTLDALAGRLGLRRHQLSELLNRELGTGFREFVTGYRVRAARELLLRRPRMTVLAIAYEVGFNSKSSFNEAFVRSEKMTPSRYRELHRGDSRSR